MSRSGSQSDNWDEFRSSDDEEHSSSDDEDIENNNNADVKEDPENGMLDESWQEALEIASSVADSSGSESGASTNSEESCDESEEEEDSQPKRKKKKYSHSHSNVSSEDETEDINYSESTDDIFAFLRGIFMVRMSTPAPGVSELQFNETVVRTYKIPISCNGTEVTFEIGRQSNINWNPDRDVLKIEVFDKANPKREVRWIEITFSPEVKHRSKEIKTTFEGNILKITFPQLAHHNDLPSFIM